MLEKLKIFKKLIDKFPVLKIQIPFLDAVFKYLLVFIFSILLFYLIRILFEYGIGLKYDFSPRNYIYSLLFSLDTIIWLSVPLFPIITYVLFLSRNTLALLPSFIILLIYILIVIILYQIYDVTDTIHDDSSDFVFLYMIEIIPFHIFHYLILFFTKRLR